MCTFTDEVLKLWDKGPEYGSFTFAIGIILSCVCATCLVYATGIQVLTIFGGL